ncbi:Stage V sporulation protein K [Acidipropionibacterium virtanenii]|uniref:Stage V sporulation protein K n=1 Tax=Acidipropionibacterium virtanenii TaxID=2057246 RepID=A0A344UXV7_9ACTN|nr:Stage V sporulation protein K [Acidipropionibacterium virtanenii]
MGWVVSTVRVGSGFRKKNLVEAITSSSPGDVLLLDPGVYPFPDGFQLKALTLRGVGERGSVVLDTTLDVTGRAALANLTVRAPAFKNAIIVRKGAQALLDGVDIVAEPASDKVGIWVTGGILEATSCTVGRARANRSENTMLCAIKADAAARVQLAQTSCPESQVWVLGASSAALSHLSAGQLYLEGGSRVSSRDLVILGNGLRRRQIVVSGQSTCELVRLHTSSQAEAFCKNGFLRLALHTTGDPLERASLPVIIEGRSAVDAPAETAHVVDPTPPEPEPYRPKTVTWPAGADWQTLTQDLKIDDTLLLEEGEHTIPETVQLQFDILGKGRPEKTLLKVEGLTVDDGARHSLSNFTLQGLPEYNALSVRPGGELTMSSVTVRNDSGRTVYTVSVQSGRLNAQGCDIECLGCIDDGVTQLSGCTFDAVRIESGDMTMDNCRVMVDGHDNSTTVSGGRLTADGSDLGNLVADGGTAELSSCDARVLYALDGGRITSDDEVRHTPVPGFFNCVVDESASVILHRLVCPDAELAMKVEGTLRVNEIEGTRQGYIDLAQDADVDLPDWIQRRDLDDNPLAQMRTASDHADQPLPAGGDTDVPDPSEQSTQTGKAASSQAPDDPMARIDALTGLDSVKAQIRRFLRTVEFNQQREAQGHHGVEMTLHSLFLGSPGTGKTTVARLLGQALAQAGAISSDVFVEVSQEDLVSPNIGETPQKTRAVLESALGGVLFIDEAYSLYQEAGSGGYGPQAVDTILKFMEDHRSDIMVIFAGYTDKMQDFLNMNPGLRSRVTNTFEFEDYTPDEIARIGLSMLADDGWSVNAELYASVVKRKYARTSDHSNGRWIRNRNQELIGVVIDRYAESGGDVSTILDEDLHTFSGGDAASRRESVDELLGQLDAMVGLAPVKAFVRDLVVQMQADQQLARAGRPASQPTYHMVFEGNPGTGKTTVAEIVAKLFHALGILENANVKTVERRDLVGGYVGHTEQQTGRAIDEAMGGVLFVDEAYQLSVEGFERDFGRQAIETLLTALENKRSSFVAIFAGYTEQMERFLDQNPGLRSRIPHTIVFPDYTSDEVGRIVVARIAADWSVNEELLGDVASSRYAALGERDRSNGRWARNFTEQVELAHKRWIVQHPDTAELTRISDEVVEGLM